MGQRARITSSMLAASDVSAHGFDKALKRIGFTPLASQTKRPPLVVECKEDLVAACAQLSSMVPEPVPEGTLPFRMVASKEETIEDEPEVDIPSTDEVEPVRHEIQPAKPKAVKVKGKKRAKLADKKAAKRYREATKAKKAEAKAKAPIVTEAKAEVKAPVVIAKAKAEVKTEVKAEVVAPKVQREKVSKPSVTDGQPMITKTLSSGKTVSKPDNSGDDVVTCVTNQGESQGKVQYVLNRISIGKVATYDHYENFLGMKTKYEERLVEQAYIDWLEEHPNVHTYSIVGRERKLVKRIERALVCIHGIDMLLGWKATQVYVPTKYDHSDALKKTHNSERSRGRANNVVSIDSKRKQGVTTGKVIEPVLIPSRSKERITAAIIARKTIANYERRKAIEQRQADRKVAEVVRQATVTELMAPRSGQITQTKDTMYPIIYCAEDALYEELRLKQEPGCGDVAKVEADPPPWDNTPEQGAPTGVASVDEQIRRLEIMEVINQDQLADDPVSYNMWLRDMQVEQEVRQRAVEGQETMLMNALGKMEARQPSTHLCCEVGRLDSWYKSKCWMSPELEEARRDSSCFEWIETLRDEGIDIPLTAIPELRRYESSLLRIERGWQEMAPIPEWTRLRGVEGWFKPGSAQALRDAKTKAILERHKQRFAARRKANGESDSNADDGVVIVLPTTILIDPRAKERGAVEGIMSQLHESTKTFANLTTQVPKEKMAALFEGFKPSENHRGLLLPQLE